MTIITDPTGRRYDIVLAEGPLDCSFERLNRTGYSPSPALPFLFARTQLDKNSEVCERGVCVRECFVHVPRQGFYVARNSPMLTNLANAKIAARKSKSGSEYGLDAAILANVLSNAIPIDGVINARTDALQGHAFFDYLLGGFAQSYGQFLDINGIKGLTIDLEQIGKNSVFVRPVYIGSLKEKSAFDPSLWLHEPDYCLAGIKPLP
jgi:hypothetical protein